MASIKGCFLALSSLSVLALAACGSPSSDAGAPTETDTAQTETNTQTAIYRTEEELRTEFEAVLAQAKATSGPGSPAMWRLADEDTTIHILGTVHLLRPELEWRSEAYEAAFEAADTIVFEVDMKSEAAQQKIMTDFMARGMFQDGQTLRGVIPDAQEPVIEAALDSVGVPLDAMNTFEPWMTAVNLSVMKLQADGYAVDSGVEEVITREAVAAGKSFGYLEEISDQADAFDLLPMQDQLVYLYETAILLDESSDMLDQLVDEWADGDVAGIASMVANPDGFGFNDAAYQSLIVKRNQNWIPVIEEMLEQPGTVLIAAGAGHFAGPDSVITMLRDKGYEVTGP
ncbi:MAG: TraB/GumN family protein [Pseudomonadota bacterium]